MQRKLEPELMDLPAEALAYAAADFSQVNQAFVERLLDLSRRTQPIRALDLGTGPADIPIQIAAARPTWRITAVDGSPAMIALARRAIDAAGAGDSITLCLADAKHTNLPPRSFDVVFSNSLLHHLPDPAGFWQEIARLAAPGALIFVRDLMRPASEVAARGVVELYASGESALLQEEFYRSLLAAFRPDEVRLQVNAAGLYALQVHPITDRHLDISGNLSLP